MAIKKPPYNIPQSSICSTSATTKAKSKNTNNTITKEKKEKFTAILERAGAVAVQAG